jgi:hypothetical protein
VILFVLTFTIVLSMIVTKDKAKATGPK